MSNQIHKTAVIEDGATLGSDISVGPFAVIGPRVVLGDGVCVKAHAVVEGNTTVGERTKIFPFAAVGTVPQDLKYGGEETRLEIGADTVIRENVTINPGTAGGGGLTRVGDRCLLMVGSHVAHDCQVGNNVILVNNATLAGHVAIDDHAILGGLCAVHQFVRIGTLAFVGGMTGVENDVIPFGSVLGNRAYLGGLNIVGLKRGNFDRDQIHALRKAYRMLFAEEGTLKERVEDVARTFSDQALVMKIVDFIRAQSDRALCTPRGAREA
ncbi:MAG: acyl-ACP--UDP-N-acetylglucosamine O-acyltransferase [Pseudomonadota bacterium]